MQNWQEVARSVSGKVGNIAEKFFDHFLDIAIFEGWMNEGKENGHDRFDVASLDLARGRHGIKSHEK
jgi:hypothetical protein